MSKAAWRWRARNDSANHRDHPRRLAFLLVYWLSGLGTPSNPNLALALLVGLSSRSSGRGSSGCTGQARSAEPAGRDPTRKSRSSSPNQQNNPPDRPEPYSQRKVRAASTTRADAPDREHRDRADRRRRAAAQGRPGTRRRERRRGQDRRRSRPAVPAGGRPAGRSRRAAGTPMNRPLARASVASARSAPGESRPEAGERERAEQQGDDEQDGTTRPARVASRGPARRPRRAGRPGRPRRRGPSRSSRRAAQSGSAATRRAASGRRSALVRGRDPEVDQARRR